MTSRGFATVLSTDDAALVALACINTYRDNPAPAGDGGGLELDEINWLDTTALVNAAPSVSWLAYMSEGTEEPNSLWIHLSRGHEVAAGTAGLYHMFHPQGVPMLRAQMPDRLADQGIYEHYRTVMTAIETSANGN